MGSESIVAGGRRAGNQAAELEGRDGEPRDTFKKSRPEESAGQNGDELNG
jgi:hypothetical protein